MGGDLGELTRHVAAGRMGRRAFIRRAVGLGLTLPAAAAVFAACAPSPSAPGASPAGTAATQAAAPARRGGGGTLKFLTVFYSEGGFQGLNPHLQFAGETDIVRAMFEPLASIQADGTLVPALAAKLPSGADVDSAGRSVVWELKKNVTWHDGKPFTAEDVIFTWRFIANPDSGARSSASYANIASVDKVDDHKVRVTFKTPSPLWWVPFTGERGHILPAHLLSSSIGTAARTAPFNQQPVGTGPYKFSQLRTGDVVVVEINDKYHVEGRPFFDRVEFKNGGGESGQAARAVLQAGEHDYAINLHVGADKALLASLTAAGSNGRLVQYPGVSSEVVHLNQSDPNTQVGGERSHISTKHPLFSDPQVRQAIAIAIDRKALADELGPPGAKVAVYLGFQNQKYFPASDPQGSKWEYNAAKANQILDAAGWVKGSDGVRAKGGVRMRVLYGTVVSAQRQSVQAVVKRQLEAIGFQVELKATPSATYLSTDPAQPDAWIHFPADILQHTISLDSPDPERTFIKFTSAQIPQKANSYAGRNHNRYRSADVDKLVADLEKEMDAAKRVTMSQRLNEILAADSAHIPLWHNAGAAGANAKLQGPAPTPWDGHTWNIEHWRR